MPEVELQARLMEQFHPEDNSWTTMTRLPDGRHHHGAALVDKAIYIIGDPCFVFFRDQELCESRGGRPRLPVSNSPCGLCGRKAGGGMEVGGEVDYIPIATLSPPERLR